MKKFYCLYNKNNSPFSWKLKQAGSKALACFKTREDCLNYYLSLNNIGIIWFQKTSVKKTSSKNIKDSFDGYIKSSMKGDWLTHTIGASSSASPKSERELKKNLFFLLQIDSITGKDLLVAKGVDRLYHNRNSYLIFDQDIAEEVMSIYDSQNIDLSENKKIFNNVSFYSSELLRDKIKNSPSEVLVEPTEKEEALVESKPEEVLVESKPEEVLVESETEFNELSHKEEINPIAEKVVELNTASNVKEIHNSNQNEKISSQDLNPNSNENINSRYVSKSFNDSLDNNEQYDFHNSNNFVENDQFSNHYYSVNQNDFDFQNDFENNSMKMQPINENELNNIFPNYFNNSDKMYYNNNNFYKVNRNLELGSELNNMKTKNYMFNQPIQNDWQYPPQPQFGTVEFTAVPNQTLNINANPLGDKTMIFNPYSSMQNSIQAYNPMYQNQREVVVQPIIQPIIQTVYKDVYVPQVKSKTIILDPIINAPISSDDYYSQYNFPTAAMMIPPQDRTSEFQFNNTINDIQQQPQFQQNSYEQQSNPNIQPSLMTAKNNFSQQKSQVEEQQLNPINTNNNFSQQKSQVEEQQLNPINTNNNFSQQKYQVEEQQLNPITTNNNIQTLPLAKEAENKKMKKQSIVLSPRELAIKKKRNLLYTLICLSIFFVVVIIVVLVLMFATNLIIK